MRLVCLSSMLKVHDTIACIIPMATIAPDTMLIPKLQDTKACKEMHVKVNNR